MDARLHAATIVSVLGHSRQEASPSLAQGAKQQRTRCEGVVYLEFIIAFLPVFLLFLGVIQLTFLYVGSLTVRHAAFRAVRAAIVVLDDDPKYYDNVPRGCLAGQSTSENNILEKLLESGLRFRSWYHESDTNLDETMSQTSHYRSGGPRLSAIRTAAYVPLLTISPDLSRLWSEESVKQAIGEAPRRLISGLIYNLGATAITVPSSPGSNDLKVTVGPKELVTVRVTHLFHCGVPIISGLICDDFYSLMSGLPLDFLKEVGSKAVSGDFTVSDVQAWNEQYKREKERLKDLEAPVAELTAAESPGLQLLGGRARFRILQAEASLPNQGASYAYPEELPAEEQPPCVTEDSEEAPE